jgi:hypothetical protein
MGFNSADHNYVGGIIFLIDNFLKSYVTPVDLKMIIKAEPLPLLVTSSKILEDNPLVYLFAR